MAVSLDRKVCIKRIQVSRDRITCTVQVEAGFCMTNPRILERALEACPDLLRHACVNDEGTRFGAVADHTDVPHLMEHLVIELQAREAKDASKVFCGVTRWIDVRQGVATIEMSFEDDLTCLAAFKEAAHLLNSVIL